MDSRYRHALAALGLFLAGVATTAAAWHGIYASALVAALAGVWLGLLTFNPRPLVNGSEPRPPERGDREAELIRLRFMLDHAPVPLLVLSDGGVLHAVNRAARSLFGTDDRILHAERQLVHTIATASPGERGTLKLSAGGPGGSERNYALSVANWSGEDGPGVLAALVDIQPELQAAEASALRELLQTLGHEIMNSLTPVMSLAETASTLLADGAPDSVPLAQDALEVITRRARGLERFVQGYREMARVPAAERRATSISRLLRDVALLFENRWRASGVGLTVTYPDPDIVAKLDPDLLAQALGALLTNGAEAALAHTVRTPKVMLSTATDGERLRFLVSDTGAGVPPEHAEAIFRPLFTLKPNGTGIGLGLARQIALTHGGELLLEPALVGHGASFALYI